MKKIRNIHRSWVFFHRMHWPVWQHSLSNSNLKSNRRSTEQENNHRRPVTSTFAAAKKLWTKPNRSSTDSIKRHWTFNPFQRQPPPWVSSPSRLTHPPSSLQDSQSPTDVLCVNHHHQPQSDQERLNRHSYTLDISIVFPQTLIGSSIHRPRSLEHFLSREKDDCWIPLTIS